MTLAGVPDEGNRLMSAVPPGGAPCSGGLEGPFPPDLVLTPVSRWPTRLPEETVRWVQTSPLPNFGTEAEGMRNRKERARFSIIIVTFNNLVFNRLCLESLLAHTDMGDCEVIVVDNRSEDGTAEYLQALARRHPAVRPMFNSDNRGFAAANNQGLALAVGDVFVLLNNDTLVPRGWLPRLVKHLENAEIGLVGPVTNRAGNEAEIETSYRTWGEFTRFAENHLRSHAGSRFDLPVLTMFCLAMRREVYERAGALDERFQVGMFEDDDYAMRARSAGWRIVCGEDVFVHHFGQASLGQLAASAEYGTLFHANRSRWEQKWGLAWKPHQRRSSPQYRQLAEEICEVVRACLPPSAVVLVVSKGDDALLQLDGRKGWHFPQTDDGVYAGYHPADSAAAIAHLEELRHRGAQFLLFPHSALWWLEHYGDFQRYLEHHYRVVFRDDQRCVIFRLDTPSEQRTNGSA